MSNPQMPYRRLGACGTQVSALSLGGWTTYGGSIKEDRQVRDILYAAFEAGVNFFDMADVYARGACEEIMGKVMADLPRHELVISSKVFMPMSDDVNDCGLSRKHIMESIDKSLQRSGLDYFDIYFCHRYDLETPLEETIRAMDDLVHQGKVLYWGTSMWSAEQLLEAHQLCDQRNLYRPQVEQPQYSLLARDRIEHEMRGAVEDTGMGMVIWSPLATGVLTGKYDQGIPEEARLANIEFLRERWYRDEILEKVRAMKPLADQLGCTRSQLALAWAMAQPAVSSVIMGATSLAQLNENLGARDVAISPEVAQQLDELFPAAPPS